jgi:bis(5'-nucleosyl)-tetraphosphatase (symmetrical)
MATYAIGDIQGCHAALQRLLGEIGFSASRDRLWLVGDLVNRGDASLEVMRFVRDLGERAITVLGNHDLHLAMIAEGHGRPSKEDTLDAVLGAPDREELLAWLRTRSMFHVEDDYAMVHAGLLPQWSIPQALELGGEVEQALRAPEYRDFLSRMWGSEPAQWSEHLRGWDRLRIVVNAMTRMRFCTRDGVMEFRAKGPLESAPEGYLPWFAVPGRASRTHTVVCGHWSALGFRREEKLLALDSGCLWGGCLTAVRLEDRKVFQLKCPQSRAPDGW